MSASSQSGRSGSDGSQIFCCKVCTRLEVSSYEGWLWHLGSREHHLNLFKAGSHKGWWQQQYSSRCVMVQGLKGLTSRQILDYLKCWGLVEDFSYVFLESGTNGLADHCFCLFRERESAMACVEQKNHEYEGRSLTVSWKSGVPSKPRSAEQEKERFRKRCANDGSGWGTSSKRSAAERE